MYVKIIAHDVYAYTEHELSNPRFNGRYICSAFNPEEIVGTTVYRLKKALLTEGTVTKYIRARRRGKVATEKDTWVIQYDGCEGKPGYMRVDSEELVGYMR